MVVCKPILVFSLSLCQSEQLPNFKIVCSQFEIHGYEISNIKQDAYKLPFLLALPVTQYYVVCNNL